MGSWLISLVPKHMVASFVKVGPSVSCSPVSPGLIQCPAHNSIVEYMRVSFPISIQFSKGLKSKRTFFPMTMRQSFSGVLSEDAGEALSPGQVWGLRKLGCHPLR